MFIHIFLNRIKVLLRSKAMLFWTLAFPIILATLFNFAFANLSNDEKFEPFNIAVVDNEENKLEENFKNVIDNLSQENDDRLFYVDYVDNKSSAKVLLEENKIKGYLVQNEKIDIFVKKSSVEETMLKSVVDSYYQTTSVIGNIAKTNPELLTSSIVGEINNTKSSYFKDISNENVDFTVVYFYALISMMCMYGGFMGISAVNETEANLSTKGARISVSPTHKLKILIIYLLAGLLLHYVEILILLAYLVFVLGVSFGSQIVYILLLALVGSFAGIAVGTLIGSCMKKSENVKIGILIPLTLTCSFLAGLMVWTMKYIIEDNIPIINRINPAAMITDGLYSLYYYNTLDRYYFNLINLLIFAVVMVVISYLFVRRKKYDSI